MNNTNDILHSAANLTKMSAMQLCYSRGKEKKVTPGMIVGDNYAKSISGAYKEMRNHYAFIDDKGIRNVIFFSFDEIVLNDDSVDFIEHKFIRNHKLVEDWLFPMSSLQLAFYYSLHRSSAIRRYVTANFALNKGERKKAIVLDGDSDCERAILNFGGIKHIVKVNDIDAIIEFYKKKALMSSNYDDASKWDKMYKHKEYSFLDNHYESHLIK